MPAPKSGWTSTKQPAAPRKSSAWKQAVNKPKTNFAAVSAVNRPRTQRAKPLKIG